MRITESNIVYSKNGYKGGVGPSIRSHRHHGNRDKNSAERNVSEGEGSPVEPYLLNTHNFDDPRFKVEYLLLSDPHANFLLTSHGAPTTKRGRTYIERCPMHDVCLNGLIHFVCDSLGDRLVDK